MDSSSEDKLMGSSPFCSIGDGVDGAISKDGVSSLSSCSDVVDALSTGSISWLLSGSGGIGVGEDKVICSPSDMFRNGPRCECCETTWWLD